jgi:hypothetical protein
LRNLFRRILAHREKMASGFIRHRRETLDRFVRRDLEGGLKCYWAALRSHPRGLPLELSFLHLVMSHAGTRGGPSFPRALLLPALHLLLDLPGPYHECDFTFRSLVGLSSWALESGDPDLSRFIYVLASKLVKPPLNDRAPYVVVGVERLADPSVFPARRTLRTGQTAEVVVPRAFCTSGDRGEQPFRRSLPDVVSAELREVSLRGSALILRKIAPSPPKGVPPQGTALGDPPGGWAEHDPSWNLVVEEDYAKPWLPTVAGHCHFVVGRVAENRVILRPQPPWGAAPRSASGILLAHRASTNYFHWLLESLTKLKYVDELGVPGEPLIVPAGMPYQHYEALKAALGEDRRPWVYYHALTGLDVDRLTAISPALFLSDDPLTPSRDICAVYDEAIEDLAGRILRNLGVADRQGAKRIYLGRMGRARTLTNESEILRFLVRQGFETVAPEILSFQEQVRLFREARVVVGPAGAAFANLIFCRPGTVALCLNADYHSENVVFPEIAGAVGAKVWQVTGPFAKRRRNERAYGAADLLHRPYSVPLDTLARALKELQI